MDDKQKTLLLSASSYVTVLCVASSGINFVTYLAVLEHINDVIETCSLLPSYFRASQTANAITYCYSMMLGTVAIIIAFTFGIDFLINAGGVTG